MTTQSTCPYCGTLISATANYCGSCGTPLKSTDGPTPPRRRARPGKRIAVWVFVVILLTFFGSGAVGGYRYQSGLWPWTPEEPLLVIDEPDVPPVTEIPSNRKPPAPSLDRYMRSMVSIQARGEQGSKTGSGFIIDTGGHIVTSAHVIEGQSGCVNVIDDNGTTHLGVVVNWDRNRDVAMLYAPTLAKWPDVLSLGEYPLTVGDGLYVLGSPKGTPNAALLSAQVEQLGLAKRIDDRFYANLVQFQGATVVHGSSGGPLLHRETGAVVGVVTAAADNSIAYAVPTYGEVANLLREWARQSVSSQCSTQMTGERVHLVLATITPLSGANGVWGNDLASGAELALRDMEADLRRVGYEVSLARYDDQGQVGLAQEHARSAAYDQEVIGVVGSFSSQVSLGVADALESSRLVMVAPTGGAEELTRAGYPHLNRLVASNARLEAEAAAFARNRLQSRSILLVLDGSAAAEQRAAAFETAAQIVALPVSGRLRVASPLDVGDLTKRVKESGADAVYYSGNSQTGFQVAQALRQQGITLPLIGGAELYNPNFEKQTSPPWKSIYFAHFTAGADDRFVRHFETILGRPTRGYGMFGYDAARVILEALVRYGEKNPAQVPERATFAALVRATRDLPGWSSTITFDETTGENRAARVHIFEWVNGQYELRE